MAPRNQTRKLPRKMVTMHQINKWFERMFEKLGWMVLAKAKGCTEKIVQYKHSVHRLVESIEHLKSEYENHNRKHDLNVLLLEAKVLDEYVQTHL